MLSLRGAVKLPRAIIGGNGELSILAGIKARHFSSDLKPKPGETKVVEPEKPRVYDLMTSAKSQRPWNSVRFSEHKPTILEVHDGSSGVSSHIPPDELKRRVKIFVPTKNACRTTDRPDYWALEMDRQPQWTSPFIGYSLTSDVYQNRGLNLMTFDTKEEAIRFCKKMGFDNYYVEDPPRILDVKGNQTYAQNFLNPHVANRRTKMEKAAFATNQFKQSGRGKTCWVNLKHTPYGAKPSEAVTQTQWTNDHPNNHKGKTYSTDDVRKQQDLARRLGK